MKEIFITGTVNLLKAYLWMLLVPFSLFGFWGEE